MLSLVMVGVLAFAAGVVVGCLIYSGRNTCVCPYCLGEKNAEDFNEPHYGIVYRPTDDPQGRRHTSWLRWASAGEPRKDFGKIESVFLINRAGPC